MDTRAGQSMLFRYKELLFTDVTCSLCPTLATCNTVTVPRSFSIQTPNASTQKHSHSVLHPTPELHNRCSDSAGSHDLTAAASAFVSLLTTTVIPAPSHASVSSSFVPINRPPPNPELYLDKPPRHLTTSTLYTLTASTSTLRTTEQPKKHQSTQPAPREHVL